MDEDLINKLSEILADKNIDLNQVLENFQATSSNTENTDNVNNSSQIDTESILKIQKILNLLNTKKRF